MIIAMILERHQAFTILRHNIYSTEARTSSQTDRFFEKPDGCQMLWRQKWQFVHVRATNFFPPTCGNLP